MANEFAYKYLEQLQAETFDAFDIRARDVHFDPHMTHERQRVIKELLTAKLGRPPTSDEVEELLQFANAELQRTMASAPTRFEEPGTFAIISGLAEQIERVISASTVSPPSRPIFGTLSTGRVNALTIAVPRSAGYLVLLERELINFALLISKAVALSFPKQETAEGVGFSLDLDDVASHLARDRTAARRFGETLLAYTTAGRPGAAPPYILPDHGYQVFSEKLRDALELFVVGHEYGHVIAGHLNSAERRASLLPTSTPTEELAYAWNQEYEADAIGAQLSAAALVQEEVDGNLVFAGGELFFSSMEVMDKAVSVLQFGDELARTLGSHPPNEYRRESLRVGLTDLLGEEDAARPIAFGKSIESVMDLLWNECRDGLVKLHRKGVRPASMWSTAQTKPHV